MTPEDLRVETVQGKALYEGHRFLGAHEHMAVLCKAHIDREGDLMWCFHLSGQTGHALLSGMIWGDVRAERIGEAVESLRIIAAEASGLADALEAAK